ncbi:M23 family metallopeptidase [Aliiglaciecola sp. LCG003]|uniref:M23 family metallopeptidase n=1 Tax=Aliiglaciecola sp. LCG003 TaxID=3053655 RepID=UPI0025729013|nr:M23 family metallopeptidase [Aliiglaciecola sp. LCG003]WJG08578.1 M23 family metallopeptidase [Aliiglaciecola sp. LCG003]
MLRKLFYIIVILTGIGLLLPSSQIIPVLGADSTDWNHDTFWHSPWGSSGMHKGIDIFAIQRTPVIASTYGVVVKVAQSDKGGRYVLVLGPKWKLHYYAHLDDTQAKPGDWLGSGQQLGLVGTTGNAAERPPHLHYAIYSLLPYFWLADDTPQGWKKMFILNPQEYLSGF